MDTSLHTEAHEGLIDLTDVPVRELWSIEVTPNLTRSVLRVRAAAEREPVKAISAFNSAI
jgi:hypothetical protein